MIDTGSIGDRIRELRGEMTQQALADTLGVSKQMISLIETGRQKPSLEMLISLSMKFGVTLDWLVLGYEPRTRPGRSVVSLRFSGMEPDDDESVELTKSLLEAIMEITLGADEDTRAWIRVQLKRAIPELQHLASVDTKKQQSAAAEDA
jgi:transcriptional regulator with XRE-family HTH domain